MTKFHFFFVLLLYSWLFKLSVHGEEVKSWVYDDPYYCFNVLSNDALVCSGKGDCVGPDACNCDDGYSGEDCQNSASNDCFGAVILGVQTCQSGSAISVEQAITTVSDGQTIELCSCSTSYELLNNVIMSANNVVFNGMGQRISQTNTQTIRIEGNGPRFHNTEFQQIRLEVRADDALIEDSTFNRATVRLIGDYSGLIVNNNTFENVRDNNAIHVEEPSTGTIIENNEFIAPTNLGNGIIKLVNLQNLVTIRDNFADGTNSIVDFIVLELSSATLSTGNLVQLERNEARRIDWFFYLNPTAIGYIWTLTVTMIEQKVCDLSASRNYENLDGYPDGFVGAEDDNISQLNMQNIFQIDAATIVNGDTCSSCNGVPVFDPSICSGNGECVSTNNCQCNDGWEGSNCETFIECYGEAYDDPLVCSAHGTCVSLDDCSCNQGYFGDECQYDFQCENIDPDDPLVCSSHGECVAEDDCSCDLGYDGDDCENFFDCFGKNATSLDVCSSRGECVAQDDCVCDLYYTSSQCQNWRCGQYLENDSKVCSQKGECVSPNQCLCDDGYFNSEQFQQLNPHGQNYTVYSVKDPLGVSLSKPYSMQFSSQSSQNLNILYQAGPSVGGLGVWSLATPYSSIEGKHTSTNAYWPYRSQTIDDDLMFYSGYDGRLGAYNIDASQTRFLENVQCVGATQLFDLSCVNGDDDTVICCSSIADGNGFTQVTFNKTSETFGTCEILDVGATNPSASVIFTDSYLYVSYYTLKTLAQYEWDVSQGGVLVNTRQDYAVPLHFPVYLHENNGQIWIGDYQSSKVTIFDISIAKFVGDVYDIGTSGGIRSFYSISNNGHVIVGGTSSSLAWLHFNRDIDEIELHQRFSYEIGDYSFESIVSHPRIENLMLISGVGGNQGQLSSLFVQPIDSQCYQEPSSCYGISGFDPQICSNHGECVAEDHCLCDFEFHGEQCSEFQCFGKNNTDPQVCNGNGECVSPGECVCAVGYLGEQCSEFQCYGKNSTDPLVCDSHGECVSPDECLCQQGYYGDECNEFDTFQCYGKNTTDPQVCSSHGECQGPDQCLCDLGYSGDDCSNFQCFGFNATLPDACSNHGECEAPDQCLCNVGYFGEKCEHWQCFGYNATDIDNVCSSEGQCTFPDHCFCETGFLGDECEIWTCSGVAFNDPLVCEGHGQCVEEDECVCNDYYEGVDCWECDTELAQRNTFNILNGSTTMDQMVMNPIDHTPEWNEFSYCNLLGTYDFWVLETITIGEAEATSELYGGTSPEASDACDAYQSEQVWNTDQNNTDIFQYIIFGTDLFNVGEIETLSISTRDTLPLNHTTESNGDFVLQFITMPTNINDTIPGVAHDVLRVELQNSINRKINSDARWRTYQAEDNTQPNYLTITDTSTRIVGEGKCLEGAQPLALKEFVEQLSSDGEACFQCVLGNDSAQVTQVCHNYDESKVMFVALSSNDNVDAQVDAFSISTRIPKHSKKWTHNIDFQNRDVAFEGGYMVHCGCEHGYEGDQCNQFECFGKNSTDPSVCTYGNGDCVAPDFCSCFLGYSGEQCENWQCFGLNSTNVNVCNGNGECLEYNECSCDVGYSGDQCQNWQCYGKNSTDVNVCSSHGQCLEYNECSCDQGYSGDQCQIGPPTPIIQCFGKNQSDPLVCSEHGECVAEDECLCDEGYLGDECSSWNCDGYPQDDPLVCSSKGECVSPNQCLCDSGYFGDDCQTFNCFDIPFDSGDVCSSKGQCISPDQCQCNTGYLGEECQTFNCFNVSKDNVDVCSSHGICISPDDCLCNDDYSGDQCQIGPPPPIQCFGKDASDVDVCSSHGICVAEDECQCFEFYEGQQCQTLSKQNITEYQNTATIIAVKRIFDRRRILKKRRR